MFSTRSVLGRVVLAICALGALIQSAQAAPLQITDAIGRDVIVESPAQRVIVGFNFEEFTAVGGAKAWERVVGLSKSPWAGWRTASWAEYTKVIPNLSRIADVGFTEENTFSVEKIVAVQPDVVILSLGEFNALGPMRDQIEAAGIPIVVIDYNAQTLEKHLSSTRAIGAVMGEQSRAEALATLYETKYTDIMRRIALAKADRKAKVYVELGRDGADTVGNTYNGTMWGKILDNLGAQNIAAGRIPGPWGQLNPELVIAANPDDIFIAGSSWVNAPKAVRLGFGSNAADARNTLATYTQRKGWEDLAAIKEKNLFTVEHSLCRTLFDYTAMQFIAKQLYPEQFADVDPNAELRNYYEKYLPVKLTGVWMLALGS